MHYVSKRRLKLQENPPIWKRMHFTDKVKLDTVYN
ncbi:hypothetical protein P872_09520 [Rhodonellum psychrophilum GCM71 = DSM 17998]|uniref:Uncharacterized protein n=1 Tax=Rhodonellum psychrophilum GCM71 = DSM 17998 TaxID=1123057 RepID=U5BV02_9BACT|nr:hypothetical protein P872_09520 [Rhodonellum psychrophilum GCM71 = DSM 17998]